MHVYILNQLQLLWLATQAKFKANISVTSAVLATMLNQRVGRKALIREAFFQSYKSLHLANRAFRELLLLVRVGLFDPIYA